MDQSLQVQQSTGYFNPVVWDAMDKMATTFIKSGALPTGINNTAQLMMIFQAGHEMGLKPVASLQNLYIVNGRVALQGSAMLQKMIEKGVGIEWKERSAEKVTAIFTRKGMAPFTATFTMKEADERKISHNYNKEKKEWIRKPVWRQFPENMLMWKVIATGGKFYCADLMGGVEVYEDIIDAQIVEDKETPMVADDKPHQKLLDKIAKARRSTLDKLEEEIVSGQWGNDARKDLVAALMNRRQALESETVDAETVELTEGEKAEAKKHAEDAEEHTAIDVPSSDKPAQPSKLDAIFKK